MARLPFSACNDVIPNEGIVDPASVDAVKGTISEHVVQLDPEKADSAIEDVGGKRWVGRDGLIDSLRAALTNTGANAGDEDSDDSASDGEFAGGPVDGAPSGLSEAFLEEGATATEAEPEIDDSLPPPPPCLPILKLRVFPLA